ncbi:MAG: fluoride efflux transporter CrcB [Verrucomicrobia bacterium]|nr:fluoride efflux transporter CrcB [Verrucomicrobiota bacterium]MDA1087419.1 fluoride efflux transporter CrcB [Verrucomicrobiota bacterium]
MANMLLVGMGGFVGSILRYGLGELVHSSLRVPAGTLAVNVIGCLLIGVVGGWYENHSFLGHSARLFLMVGILGGFTTFSAFGYETMHLARNRELAIAMANILLQVALGLVAVWIGYRLSLVRL